jgi:hypothetical protein
MESSPSATSTAEPRTAGVDPKASKDISMRRVSLVVSSAISGRRATATGTAEPKLAASAHRSRTSSIITARHGARGGGDQITRISNTPTSARPPSICKGSTPRRSSPPSAPEGADDVGQRRVATLSDCIKRGSAPALPLRPTRAGVCALTRETTARRPERARRGLPARSAASTWKHESECDAGELQPTPAFRAGACSQRDPS